MRDYEKDMAEYEAELARYAREVEEEQKQAAALKAAAEEKKRKAEEAAKSNGVNHEQVDLGTENQACEGNKTPSIGGSICQMDRTSERGSKRNGSVKNGSLRLT